MANRVYGFRFISQTGRYCLTYDGTMSRADATKELTRLNAELAAISTPADPEEGFDFDSGLGIGGLARHSEPVTPAPENTMDNPRWAGTTDHGNDKGHCSECGAPAWWNSGAGKFLCDRHWDEY